MMPIKPSSLRLPTLTLTLTLTLLSSCISYPKLPAPALELNAGNIKRLEARYDFSGRLEPAIPEIDLLLADYTYRNSFIDKGEKVEVQLELKDEETIIAHVYRNGIYVSKHELKGELKAGTFRIKRQSYRNVSEGYVLSTSYHQKSKLALSPRGGLLINTRRRLFFDFLFFPIESEMTEYRIEVNRILNY